MALRPREVASKATFENWILRPEIAQRLRIFTVLAENQSSVPSIHTGWLATTYLTLASSSLIPLTSTDIYTPYVHTSPQNT